jgi:hypothetical protein
MPVSGAERQRHYRERHHDDLAHITLNVRVAERGRLDRLAWHFGWSLTSWSRNRRGVSDSRSKRSCQRPEM